MVLAVLQGLLLPLQRQLCSALWKTLIFDFNISWVAIALHMVMAQGKKGCGQKATATFSCACMSESPEQGGSPGDA